MDYYWKKVHGVIKFNQRGWLKPNIDITDMNIELRKNAKYDFKKDSFKLMNKYIFVLFDQCKM